MATIVAASEDVRIGLGLRSLKKMVFPTYRRCAVRGRRKSDRVFFHGEAVPSWHNAFGASLDSVAFKQRWNTKYI